MGIPAHSAELFHDVELEYEKGELRANSALLDLLQDVARQGVRLIYASDMYLSAADIDQLLVECGVDLPFAGRYASSDSGLSKRSGALFGLIEEDQNARGRRLLHLGDSMESDVRRAAAVGWRAIHTPRSRAWRVVRALRQQLLRADLYRRGLNV